jgi:PKD repeat protein
MRKLLVLSLLFLITIIGCVNITQPPATQPVTPPVVVTFSANPTEIKTGESATLLWNVTGATAVAIDQGIGNVAVASSKTVSPTKTTTYTLTATNSAGTNSQSITLTVGGVSILPGVELEKTPHIPPITLNQTAFDFINEASSASWRDSNGPLAFGSRVAFHYDELLGDGLKYPKILVLYGKQYPDFVEGTYPEIKIPAGAHFVAKVSYPTGVQFNVGVDFCISFIETSTGFVTSLACKDVAPDQNFYSFDIDLSSIVGKTGRISLHTATAPGSYPQLYAKWVDTKIIR